VTALRGRDTDAAILEHVLHAALLAHGAQGAAALLLHCAFPHDTGFVATFVGCSEDDLAGLVATARARLRCDRAALVTEPIRALRHLRSAWRGGENEAVTELLSADVEVFAADGLGAGGLRVPVRGSREVAALLIDIVGGEPPALELAVVGGVPWLVGRYEELAVGFLAAEVLHESVTQVWLVAGPDKLSRGDTPRTGG
jgi:hypothetical protein